MPAAVTSRTTSTSPAGNHRHHLHMLLRAHHHRQLLRRLPPPHYPARSLTPAGVRPVRIQARTAHLPGNRQQQASERPIGLMIGFPAPPPKLASLRDTATWHEAGHAVAMHVTGLQLTGSRIRVRRSLAVTVRPGGLAVLPAWRVTGRTRFRRSFLFLLPDELAEADLIATLAGPEAEARRISVLSGVPLGEARRQAIARNTHDFLDARAALNRTSLTFVQASDRTADLVRAHWAAIGEAAGLLASSGRLSAAQVEEAVLRCGPCRQASTLHIDTAI